MAKKPTSNTTTKNNVTKNTAACETIKGSEVSLLQQECCCA